MLHEELKSGGMDGVADGKPDARPSVMLPAAKDRVAVEEDACEVPATTGAELTRRVGHCQSLGRVVVNAALFAPLVALRVRVATG